MYWIAGAIILLSAWIASQSRRNCFAAPVFTLGIGIGIIIGGLLK